jgi:hypothetical protein
MAVGFDEITIMAVADAVCVVDAAAPDLIARLNVECAATILADMLLDFLPHG